MAPLSSAVVTLTLKTLPFFISSITGLERSFACLAATGAKVMPPKRSRPYGSLPACSALMLQRVDAGFSGAAACCFGTQPR